MRARVTIDTPFHIDFGWWERRGRNLATFLADILGDEADADAPDTPLDFIDPGTAEVFQVDPLWVQVLLTKAKQPDYITAHTPMTGAVLRALIESLNRPMSAVELHRRLGRSNPQTILRLLRTACRQYGILPANEPSA